MATYKYLDNAGLSQLWSKAKTAFADKSTTETELAKKFELPEGGTDGQILTKTSSGTEWTSLEIESSSLELVTLWEGSISNNNTSAPSMTLSESCENYNLLIVTATSGSVSIYFPCVKRQKSNSGYYFYMGFNHYSTIDKSYATMVFSARDASGDGLTLRPASMGGSGGFSYYIIYEQPSSTAAYWPAPYVTITQVQGGRI